MSGPPPSTKVEDDLARLFSSIETKFKSTQLNNDSWYILALACLTASPDPEASSQLYTYLTSQPHYTTSDSRKALVRRLREVLVKSIPIIGVCKPIEAIVAISQVERPEDKDFTSTRENWQCDEANHERAMGWLRKVYTQNTSSTLGLFDAHKDFAWISTEITYGLYLSDRQVLGDTDTQLVTLSGMMMQNLKNESHWHIRGTRRIGVSKDDVQIIWDAIQGVAKHFGMKLHKVSTVDEVELDV
ncbi:uncharacterized protein BCR38DRAFT_35331 [Pseudomassariella vexata]|uniref:AhpD-like protein n=1 Tax=Pseudomassariella vexata TaxID=1141098 RepID=A0A1Y2DQR8_9PEZI|nr:uncharacterized protein BCR38DRAFT_35331 [Pseudomassariella vexata]ORY61484.1 hypothetical protein BCR38DRAFT_35331 [Pseudomassariella vexata]